MWWIESCIQVLLLAVLLPPMTSLNNLPVPDGSARNLRERQVFVCRLPFSHIPVDLLAFLSAKHGRLSSVHTSMIIELHGEMIPVRSVRCRPCGQVVTGDLNEVSRD